MPQGSQVLMSGREDVRPPDYVNSQWGREHNYDAIFQRLQNDTASQQERALYPNASSVDDVIRMAQARGLAERGSDSTWGRFRDGLVEIAPYAAAAVALGWGLPSLLGAGGTATGAATAGEAALGDLTATGAADLAAGGGFALPGAMTAGEAAMGASALPGITTVAGGALALPGGGVPAGMATSLMELAPGMSAAEEAAAMGLPYTTEGGIQPSGGSMPVPPIPNLGSNGSQQPGATQPASPGADWLSRLLNAGGQYLAGQQTGDAFGEAYKAADPFAQYRPAFGARLNELYANPNSFMDTPFVHSLMDQGTNAINAHAAATGGLGSGKQKMDLMKYGQSVAGQNFFDYANSMQAPAGVNNAGVGSELLLQSLLNKNAGNVGGIAGGLGALAGTGGPLASVGSGLGSLISSGLTGIGDVLGHSIGGLGDLLHSGWDWLTGGSNG